MPAERVRFDIEIVSLLAVAVAASIVLTGEVFTEVATSALLMILFSLIGLHTDWRGVRNHLHKRKELAVSVLSVYVLAPLASLPFYFYLPGEMGLAVFLVGISAGSIGASVVWTNRAGGDGNTALMASGVSLVLALVFIPLWILGLESSAGALEFVLKNLWIVLGPLTFGSILRKLPIRMVEDLKNNFSGAGLFLIAFLLFFQMVELSSGGVIGVQDLLLSSAVMSVFVCITFGAGYLFSRLSGLEEKQSRAIGFVTGDKAFAVSLFVAIQFGSLVVQYVIVYYFASRIMMSFVSQFFRHGSLEKCLEHYREELRNEITDFL